MNADYPSRKTQATRYLTVGLSVLAIDFLGYLLLTLIWPSAYVEANIASKSIAAGSGFFLHKHYTFAGVQNKSTLKQIILYLALYLGNTALSSAIIFTGVALIGIHQVIAKIIADGTVVVTSFLVNRSVVFKHSTTSAS